MRWIVCVVAAVGCETGGYEFDGDSGFEGYTDPSVQPESRSAWVTVENGYCAYYRSADGGASWYDDGVVNVSNPAQAVQIESGEDILLEIFCNAEVVPQYDPPKVEIDPSSCPMVYCNPWGNTNKLGGEAEDCGQNLWVYVDPHNNGNTGNCGPWDLVP